MSNLLDDLDKEMNEKLEGPTDSELATMRDKANELLAVDDEISQLEEKLKKANVRSFELRHKTLPDLMKEIDIDQFSIASAGKQLELKPYYKASISASWDEERQARAYDHMGELEIDDLIRTEVVFTLGKDSTDLARTIVASLRMLAEAMEMEGVSDIPQPSVRRSVPWNSLTSAVKEMSEKGKPFDLETLGATVGDVVKIKETKK